jgi:hypothetical protein
MSAAGFYECLLEPWRRPGLVVSTVGTEGANLVTEVRREPEKANPGSNVARAPRFMVVVSQM